MFVRIFAAALAAAAFAAGGASAGSLNAPATRYNATTTSLFGGPSGFHGYTATVCTPQWVIAGYKSTVPIYQNTCTGQTRLGIN